MCVCLCVSDRRVGTCVINIQLLCLSRELLFEGTLSCFATSSLSLVLIQYKFIGLKMYKQIDSKESWVKLKVAVLKLLA